MCRLDEALNKPAKHYRHYFHSPLNQNLMLNYHALPKESMTIFHHN